MKIIKYKIVEEGSSISLWYSVNKEIEDGWQPYGSMVVKKHNCYQAMVMYDDTEKGEI